MRIEFDDEKRRVTLEARGLDMAEAGSVISGFNLTVEDLRQDYGERRFITVGHLNGRMVVVVWTPRGDSCRIISMRNANEREQAYYGPRFRG